VCAEEIHGRDQATAAPILARIIRARRLRGRYFAQELFADPAWDMLLASFEAELSQQRVTVTDLCISASVPGTTALRWLNDLVARGFLIRLADPRDGRRVFVELSPAASLALHRYFNDLGEVQVI
jgi:DNA-binding MarR family transcriptional regulator